MENERPASLLVGTIVGAAVAVAAVPSIAPAIENALFSPEPKAWWFVCRSTGLVAFALLAASTIFGLLVSGKVAKGWPVAIHEHTSLVGLGFAAVHAVVLFGNRHASWDWVGQLALYLMAIVVGSFYVRRRIGARVWRILHFASFAVFALALAHAITTGTDHGWVDLLYVLPGAAIVFLAVHRLLGEWSAGPRALRS